MSSAAVPHLVLRRVERQHALIEHLGTRAPRPTTARALAEGLGVAVRTVERDLAGLRAAGVPITVRGGPGGGYRLDRRQQVPSVALTQGELAALIASLVAVGPTASASAVSAMTKLLDALAPAAADPQDTDVAVMSTVKPLARARGRGAEGLRG